MKRCAVCMLALAAAAGAAIAGPPKVATEPSTDPSVAELKGIVQQLRDQVEELKAQNGDNWLSEQRAEQIKGVVQDVLADADARASLLQNGAVAGYDKNFFLGSADGNFLLKVAGQMQFRFVYNTVDSPVTDNNRLGFENRRTKLRFFGHVVDPSWQYLILMGFDRDGGVAVLDEAHITKDFSNGWKIRTGQFKPPFMREELVSSSKQLAVERSLVNEEFNQDRVQGLELSYKGERFAVAGAFSDGFYPSANGTDNTGWGTEDTEWAFTGRAEFLASGDWKMFEDFNGWKGGGTGVLLGAAAHYQNDEYGTMGTNPWTGFFPGTVGAVTEIEALHLTADVSVKFDGVGLFAAVVYRQLDPNVAGGADFASLGFVLQGGGFVTDDVELFARYEWGDADLPLTDDLSVVTVGVNKYWAKHNLKWQNDLGFGLATVAGVWSTSSAGWRSDTGANDGQVVFRSQLQLLF